jgi:hypothetical protein
MALYRGATGISKRANFVEKDKQNRAKYFSATKRES